MEYVYKEGALVSVCKRLGADKICNSARRRLRSDPTLLTQNQECFLLGPPENGDERETVFAAKDLKKGTLLPYSITPYDVSFVQIPPIVEGEIDIKSLEKAIEEYNKTEAMCNVEYYYDATKKNREWGRRLSKDVKKGDQLHAHFNPLQSIVQLVLAPKAEFRTKLSKQSLLEIEKLCIGIMGEDIAKAAGVYTWVLDM